MSKVTTWVGCVLLALWLSACMAEQAEPSGAEVPEETRDTTAANDAGWDPTDAEPLDLGPGPDALALDMDPWAADGGIGCATDDQCPPELACRGGYCREPAYEACGNGVDDNGDGRVDEDCDGAGDGQCQFGGCRPWQACTESGHCANTACEGDVDCPDESRCVDQRCTGAPCAGLTAAGRCDGETAIWCDGSGFSYIGCAGMSRVCRSDLGRGAGQCVLPPPTVDQCGDGVDNDLDAQVDEGCGEAACGGGAGCIPGDACDEGVCRVVERCGDGVDNDGDGVVDEACPLSCAADQDCVFWEYCEAGLCQPGCGPGRCRGGTVCDVATRACVPG